MIRTQVLKHLSGARDGKRGGSKGNVRGGVLKKNRYVGIIERKEV